MKTVPELLTALSVTDTLKHPSVPASLTNIPWQLAVGSWSEASGWSPSSFSANPPTNTRSGLYLNTGEQSGDHAVGLKKTTGSLAAVERQFEVWMCSAMGAKASGYQLAVITNKSSNGKVRFVLSRFVEGERKVLFETNEEQTFNENDSFYLAKVDNALLIYYRAGEGTPVLLGGAIDETFTKGFAGFGGNGSNPKLINFTVGALAMNEEVQRFRRMNGASGTAVITSIGSCNRTEDVTLVALIRVPEKPTSNSEYSVIQIAASGGAARGYRLAIVTVNGASTAQLRCQWLETEENQSISTTPGKPFTFDDHWKLVVVRKEVGSKKADFGVFDLVTREWTWEEGSEGAKATKSESFATGQVWFGSANSFNMLKGDYAAAMIGAVMSRAAIEAALSSMNSLLDMRSSAVGLWFFNKAAIGEKVEDETGNGANQTNTPSAGSVVSEPPPIPYYTPTVSFSRALISGTMRFIKRWVYALGALRRE